MKEISKLNVQDDIRYAPTHEWAKTDGEFILIGISDYAQDQLGDVVYVELPEIGAVLSKGQEFGTVESVKAVSEIYMPVGGEIMKLNENLTDNPALVNESPYNDGWFCKIKPADAGEFDSLLSKEEYLTALGAQE